MRRLLSQMRFQRGAVCLAVLALLLAATSPMPMAWGGEGVTADHHCSEDPAPNQGGADHHHHHCQVCAVPDQTGWGGGTQMVLPGRNWPLLAFVPRRWAQDDASFVAWFPMGAPRAPPVVV